MRVDFRDLHHAPPRHLSHLMGLGVCQTGPIYGNLANGDPICIDENTGNEVDCSSPVCAAPTTSSSPASGGTSVLGPPPPANITLGCGADLETYIYQAAAGFIAMPSSFTAGFPGMTISEALTNVANSVCAESSAGSSFGCPPMACDAGTIASLVAKYAALAQPAVSQYQATGMYAPTPAGSAPYVPPVYNTSPSQKVRQLNLPVVQPPSSTATPPPPGVTPSGSQPVGASNTANSNSSNTSTTDWFTQQMISGIPNWGLLLAGGALVFLMVSMGGRK